MNYYIIPKIVVNVKLKLQLTSDKLVPFISHSLFYYLNNTYNQIDKIQKNDKNDENELTIKHIQIVYDLSLKMKLGSIIFFELIELFQIFNIKDLINTKENINIAQLTNNYSTTSYFLNTLRQHNNDTNISSDFNYEFLFLLFINNNYNYKLDLLICEFCPDDYNNVNKYIRNMLLVLLIILKHQNPNGICIIKIDNIFYKSIVEIIFILSSLYDKIYLTKPYISNIIKGDRYIICKGFNSTSKSGLEEQLLTYLFMINNSSDNIYSILENEIPCFFLNKLEESNIIIGQQQIEAYDQIINIFKHKNRYEKIEILKKNNIQKIIQWCEKNQLPYNSFIDKTNIFFTPKQNTMIEISNDK